MIKTSFMPLEMEKNEGISHIRLQLAIDMAKALMSHISFTINTSKQVDLDQSPIEL